MPDWRTKAMERVKDKSSGATIKLDEGINCLRIMPDKKDLLPDGNLNPRGIRNPPYREFRTHRDVGPDKAFVGCGKDIEGNGDCWLCDVKIPELQATGNSNKLLVADAIHPSEQFLVQAARFDTDYKKLGMPKPWWVSTGSGVPGKQAQSLAVRIFSKIASSRKDFIDPVKGYNINVERTGQMLKTRYPSIEADEAPSTVPLAVRLALKDLDSLIPVYDEEDQKAAYYGRPRKEESGETEKPLRSQPRSSRKPVEDEEPAEETESAEETPDDVEYGEPDAEAEEAEETETETEAETETETEPVEEQEEEVEDEPEPEPPPPPTKKRAPAPPPKPPAKKAAPPTKKR